MDHQETYQTVAGAIPNYSTLTYSPNGTIPCPFELLDGADGGGNF